MNNLEKGITNILNSIGRSHACEITEKALVAANAACQALAEQNGLAFTPLLFAEVFPELAEQLQQDTPSVAPKQP